MKFLVVLLMATLLAGCGSSVYGRSGSGGTVVGGSRPVAVWAAPGN